MADALDMLADASAYAIALLAVTRGTFFKARAALWSGTILLLLGVGILAKVARKWLHGDEPQGTIMMAFLLLSLMVNVTSCVYLLLFAKAKCICVPYGFLSRQMSSPTLVVFLPARWSVF